MAIAIIIGALTLIPMSMEPSAPGSDKTHHFLAFAALVLPCAALYPKGLLKGALAAAAYGGLIELIQPYVGRSGEIADLVADVSGIGAGAALGLVVHAILRRISGVWSRTAKDRDIRPCARETPRPQP